MKDLKAESLKRLSSVRDRTTKGDVNPALLGEFMLILVGIKNELGLDLMRLGAIGEKDRIQPPGLRQANDPRPITTDDYGKFLVRGDVFRLRVAEAIQRLGAHDLPKPPIGFVR
jgi:hypothetical protein